MTEQKHDRPGAIVASLPPGRYFIGDPCYVIRDDQRWSTLCRQLGDEGRGGLITIGNHQLVAFGTACGDGLYHDRDGHHYSVDAGMIGAVPKDAVDDWRNSEFGRWVDFPKRIRCVRSPGGVLHFGGVRIDTRG